MDHLPVLARRTHLRPAVRDARRRLGPPPRLDRRRQDHLRLVPARLEARLLRLLPRAQKECPPRPDPSAGYVWPLDPFDIYTANVDGSDLKRLTNYNVYTAEAVLSPDGKKIVFTSLKDGDLEIYTMNVDGSDVRRLTNTPGYDGGPWWSPDGKKIVYRAHHPQDEAQLADYRKLLAQNMIRPSRVELFVMNADGSDQRQVTALGGANFGPSWTPDGQKIIFSSNHPAPRSGNFDLYLVDAAATKAGPDGARADHLRSDLRRFPDVPPRRQAADLGLESEVRQAGGDEPLRRGLEVGASHGQLAARLPLRRLPEGFHFVEGRFLRRPALLRRPCFDVGEA